MGALDRMLSRNIHAALTELGADAARVSHAAERITGIHAEEEDEGINFSLQAVTTQDMLRASK
jgi:hypothetical protein